MGKKELKLLSSLSVSELLNMYIAYVIYASSISSNIVNRK